MFGSTLLDIVIGLIFVYLLLSLICSALNELIEAGLKKRAADLERGIRELLHEDKGTGLLKALYEHPLVSGLFKGKYDPGKTRNLPSYIPARNFALALMDIVQPGQQNTLSGAAGATVTTTTPAAGATGATASPGALPAGASTPTLRDAISSISNTEVKRALTTLVDAAGDDISKARENIEAWYNSSMDRVTGWYKRRGQLFILALGFLVVVAINADTIAITTSLSRDKAVRDSVVAEAQEFAKQQAASGKAMEGVDKYTARIRNLGLPLGWSKGNLLSIPDKTKPDGSTSWPMKVIGWLITTVAISLGAPFWFDLLNKFIALRSSIKPKEISPDEGAS
jgi:hypothetical protein